MVHANGPIDGGWGVTEVWEAQENWDPWYEGTIKPNLPEGMKPRITTRELHHVMQPWLAAIMRRRGRGRLGQQRR